MRQSFPNRPFFTENPVVVPETPTVVEPPHSSVEPPTFATEILDASSKRRDEVHAVLQAERFRRDWLRDAELLEASRVERENEIIDHYDAGAKIHRGQGNRKFVVHLAVAAGATMLSLVAFDAFVSAMKEAQ